MTAPAVEAEIDELIDLAWEVVYDLLLDRGECSATGFRRSTPHTAIHSWLEGLNWYTVVRSGGSPSSCWHVAQDTIVFHHDVLGADDPKSFYTVVEVWPG